MTSIFTVVKGQQKHRYTRSTNARLSKNILVTVRNALFLIKTYTTSAFPKIPVTNITIKMIGTTRSAMMFFSVFIVDQCSKDKLKWPKKEAFWFIPACSPDITQEMLLVLYWLSVLPRALAATSLTSVITWDFNKRKSRVLSAGNIDLWIVTSFFIKLIHMPETVSFVDKQIQMLIWNFYYYILFGNIFYIQNRSVLKKQSQRD